MYESAELRERACRRYFPVKVEALPEGSVVNVHVPVYQVRSPYPLTLAVGSSGFA